MITLDTHKGVELHDYTYEIVEVVDLPLEQKFVPRIIFCEGRNNISHTLPPHDYINGTWEDVDVRNYVKAYVTSLDK